MAELPSDIEKFLTDDAFAAIEEAVALQTSEAKDEAQPFKEKYDARRILEKVGKQLDACRSKLEGDETQALSLLTVLDEITGQVNQKTEVNSLSAVVKYTLGINYYESEELGESEKSLVAALEQLRERGNRFHVEIMDCLNHLGMIWSARGEHEKASKYLDEAHDLHKTQIQVMRDKVESSTGPANLEKRVSAAERHFTSTLFLMAQVYQHLGKPEQSALFCQQTLDRQLHLEGFDRDDWVKNAVQLSGFFLSQCRFLDAAKCLAASEWVVKQSKEGVSDENLANLHWGWAKIQIARITAGVDGQEISKPQANGIQFEIKEFEEYIPSAIDQEVTTYEQGCAAFKAAQSSLKKVMEAFPMDGSVTEHIHAVQDMSRAYKDLARFCSEKDDVCKMYKRRIDLLEPIVIQLNVASFDVQCKELWFEIGEAYRDMLEIKSGQVENGEKKISGSKLIGLAEGAIKAYKSFISLFLPVPKDPEVKDKNEPQGLSDPRVRRWYLLAYFGLARALSKKPAPELDDRRKILGEALDQYKKIVELHEKMPFEKDGPVNFEAELQICKDMIELMPVKIQRLHTLDSGKTGTL